MKGLKDFEGFHVEMKLGVRGGGRKEVRIRWGVYMGVEEGAEVKCKGKQVDAVRFKC